MNTTPSLAIPMLMLTTVFWALSFPFIRALGIEQQALVPGVNTMCASLAALAFRFGVAAVVLLLVCIPTIRHLTRRELVHGLVLGGILALGAFLHADGVNYTSSSVGGFLMSFYVVLVPVFVALSSRKLPSLKIMAACVLVLTGIAILVRLDFRALSLGRGEVEILLSSTTGAAQILWMTRIDPMRDRATHVSVVMNTVVMIVAGVAVLGLVRDPSAIYEMHSSTRAWVLDGAAGVLCVAVPFLLMTKFQPGIDPSLAGIIYCLEPPIIAVFATFMPQMLVRDPALFPNETITGSLLLGGLLITAANVMAQIRFRGGRTSL